jgi:hypothetical protein
MIDEYSIIIKLSIELKLLNMCPAVNTIATSPEVATVPDLPEFYSGYGRYLRYPTREQLHPSSIYRVPMSRTEYPP